MGVCTNQECVLTGSVYSPGVCTKRACVLTMSVYQPGVCTKQVEYCTIRSDCCWEHISHSTPLDIPITM